MNDHSIQIRDVDFNNEVELHELAYLYAAVPLDWDASYAVQREAEINFSWLLEKRDTLKCLLATLGSKIVGIHVLQTQSQRPHTCFIKTLWVSPDFRGEGIGSRLKAAGEQWVRETGSKAMVTHVMVKNSKMLEINRSKGFVPTKVEMEKKL